MLPHILFISLCMLHCRAQYGDTVLQRKCEFLKTKARTGYIDSSCFVTKEKEFSTSDDREALHKQCNDLGGYRGRMAFVKKQEQMNELLKQDVVEPGGKYLIGVEQADDQWVYVDEKNEIGEQVATALWLPEQPAEGMTIAIISRPDEKTLGFSTVGSSKTLKMKILCEYEDFLHCKTAGYKLIGNRCYKMFANAETPEKAQSNCNEEGGSLASIHNDRQNQLLATMGRRAIGDTAVGASKQWAPMMIGLRFDDNSKSWTWSDNSKVDYYHWWGNKNGSSTEAYPASKGNKYVYVYTTVNGDNGVAAFGYWGNNLQSTSSAAFVCQQEPVFG